MSVFTALSDDALAQIVWDYHQMHHAMSYMAPDAIILLGNNTLEQTVARMVELCSHYGCTPWMVFTGARGHLTEDMECTEAETGAALARAMGIPEEKILIEPTATNTGDNVKFTKKLLEDEGITIKTAIAVQKPFMERRIFGTFQHFWPELDVRVTSPQVSFANYPTAEFPKDRVTSVMVGDLLRIKAYGGKFMTVQAIPDDVWEAGQELIRRGYIKDLPPPPKQ